MEPKPMKGRAPVHILSLENQAGLSRGTQFPREGPLLVVQHGGTAWQLAREENNTLAAENTGFLIQVPATPKPVFILAHSCPVFPAGLLHTALLKHKSPNARKTGLVYVISVGIWSHVISFYALIWYLFILHCIIFFIFIF